MRPAQQAIEDVWRREAPHVLAALARRFGSFEDCEDAAQEAFLAATDQWPREGVPSDPKAWLVRVASRRLIDRWRSESSRAEREVREAGRVPGVDVSAPSAEQRALEEDGIPVAAGGDDTLGLLLLCCHPAVSVPSRVALTLRAVAGLTTRQIAAGFFVTEATMAQRISRAKATLRTQGARLDQVPEAELPDRLGSVLHVLNLVFTEGHAASVGDRVTDRRLTDEAIRLTRHLCRQVPDHREAAGLLALMLLTDARRAARTTSDGNLIPLGEQDRSRWDREQICEGVRILEQVLPLGPTGPFQVRAAIAAVHAEAPTAEETDWAQICVLYRMLQHLDTSHAVTLNLAVAVGMHQGPAQGLAVLGPLLQVPEMTRHHRTHAVRAHLLEMTGRAEEAHAAYRRAAQLTASTPEQRYLLRRAASLSEQD
ncbi:RNA polymerase sigma factor [Ornithinicoccus hortensis]|uniref:RNA polymerase ECF family sigma subunit n=1 Tax=Ornithinicoccus hortensis TaxID=82346 RepID=A0A542YUR1_9MICO|nr:sigma-70 family RNA polymerase sigma factor [Ornithinicoccus hortensis]TQL51821.1 RNA polymerase ECF family sigma subunit [Ornithinicoccus hortensis]